MKSVKVESLDLHSINTVQCPNCGSLRISSMSSVLCGTPDSWNGEGMNTVFSGVFNNRLYADDDQCRDHIEGHIRICKDCKQLFFAYEEKDTRSCAQCPHYISQFPRSSCRWNSDLEIHPDYVVNCQHIDKREVEIDPQLRCVTCKFACVSNTDLYFTNYANQTIADAKAKLERGKTDPNHPQYKPPFMYQVPQYLKCSQSRASVSFREHVCMSYEPSRPKFIDYLKQCKEAGCLFPDVTLPFELTPCDLLVKLTLPPKTTYVEMKDCLDKIVSREKIGTLRPIASNENSFENTVSLCNMSHRFLSFEQSAVDPNLVLAKVRFEGPLGKTAAAMFISHLVDFSYLALFADGDIDTDEPNENKDVVCILRWDLVDILSLEKPANKDHTFTLEQFGLVEPEDNLVSETIKMKP